jgi:hypothetical protein
MDSGTAIARRACAPWTLHLHALADRQAFGFAGSPQAFGFSISHRRTTAGVIGAAICFAIIEDMLSSP